jgi:hypothetical protein
MGPTCRRIARVAAFDRPDLAAPSIQSDRSSKMKRKTRKSSYVTLAAGVLSALAFSTPLQAAEWEQNTPYYEKDGWLDISEWFDGNSYNPTDESTWRWDDESYDFHEDTGADADNDTWYGYTARNDDDWFYDYYDPSSFYTFDSDSVYAYGARYLDYDDDGAYDASVSYTDWNGDGIYDDYDYFIFNNSSGGANPGQQKRPDRLKQQLPNESRQQSITGTVENVKQVRVRGDGHTVVQIRTGSGEMLAVDLGRKANVASLNLNKGSRITVHGPRSRVGEKPVVLAKSVESAGSTVQIDRKRREITGTVVSTHRQQVHGLENVFAIVEVSDASAANSQRKASAPNTQQDATGTVNARQPATGTVNTQQQGAAANQGAATASSDRQQQAGERVADSNAKPLPGRNRIAVDLGPAKRLGTEIKPGMTLTFTAVPVKVSDRRMMLAQTIRRDGRSIPIDRRTSVSQQARMGATPANVAQPPSKPASDTQRQAPASAASQSPQQRGEATAPAGHGNTPGMELQRTPPAAANR